MTFDLVRRLRLGLMVIIACGAAPMAGWAQTTNLVEGGDTVFVPYVNGTNGPEAGLQPTVGLGFDDSSHVSSFTMDTGSTGIVVSADLFHPGPDSKKLGPGSQTYSSSGRIEEGFWYTAKEKIYDANGNLVATAEVPVLRITRIRCTADARDCTPTNDPKGVSIMGVGFARESSTQTHATPNYNAFLNLTSVAGPSGALEPLPADWHYGYVVTPTGVYLGLTSSNTANAALVKLLPDTANSLPGKPEWTAAPVTIIVNGKSSSGHVLMDTGLTTGLLSDPSYQGSLVQCPKGSEGGDQCLPSGTMVAVTLPGQAHSAAFYTFTVDQANTVMQPNGGLAIDSETSKLFNTSVSVLNGISFFYDEENGFIGYISNGRSSFFAHVTPEFALEGPWDVGNGFFTDMPTYLFGATTLMPQGSSEFAGRLQSSSTGSLTIDGPGTVELSGGAALDAPITVHRGDLAINSVITAPLLQVDSAGVLSGTGLIAAPTRVAGILSPGNNAPGTLMFDTPVTMLPGGILNIDLGGTWTRTGPGNYSSVLLFGSKSSFTAAGTLAPVLTSGAGNISANFVPAIGQTFGIVQAEGGVLGSFTSLIQPDGLAPGTRLDALYGPDAIALVVTPADFSDLASLGIPETPNQSAIGSLLDLVRPEGGQMTPGQQALFQSLFTLPSTSITAAINELSPEIYADALMTTRNAWYLMANAIGGQLEARRGLVQSNTASSASGPNGSTVWASGIGETSNTYGSDNSSGYTTGLGGAAFGIDMPVGQSIRLGFAAGATGGQTNAQVGGQASSETAQLETYGQWQSGM
ncbi:MAG TPA: autotransporter outer membrane beta-barrel domain-containing protein, partial [Verrucomicrobiae bacterium]|nr:autotransporter outer membrane beta-barrel domain-containing protein [Verrucomicrobiae bacterium]